MCSAKEKLDINPPIEINPEKLSAMIDSIQSPVRISFTGGEPLVYFNKHKDVLMNMVKNEHIHLHLITNGLLLNDSIIDILKEDANGFTIAFSVDGYKDVYNEIRVGSDWEKIDAVIKKISNLSKYKSNINIFIRYVLMNKTADCYVDFVNHALENWDVSHIKVDLLLLDSKLENKKLMLNSVDKSLFKDKINYISQFGDIHANGSLIIKPETYNQITAYDIEDQQNDAFLCSLPFYSMTIYYDGNVVPCCNSTNFCLGNIYKKNIYDVWNGEAIKSLRQEILNNNKHNLCLCNDVTCFSHGFNEEKFDKPDSRIPNSFHERKKYIKEILETYKIKHKKDDNLDFLEKSDISPYDKTSIPIYSELAAGYMYRKKDYNKASSFCEVILNVIPDHYDTLIKKAIINFNLGKITRAISIIEEQVLSQQREHNLAYFWLGYFYESTDLDKTYEYYNIFINLDNVDVNSWGYQHCLDVLKNK